jgi:hypothetical protein
MTTIKNTAPATVVVTNITVAYTLACIANNIGVDTDIAGRVVVLGNAFKAKYSGDGPYTVVTEFAQSTNYNLKIGRYDSMNNTALIEAGFNVNFTAPVVVRMRDYPAITSHTVSGEFVEVGSSPPLLNLVMAGSADTLQVEYSVVGANVWTLGWSGPFSALVRIPGLPVGTWDIRVRGIIDIPSFPYVEASGWVGLSAVVLSNQFESPGTPTALSVIVGRLAEPAERYDAEVSWTWTRGTGPEIRYFVLERLDVTRYVADWSMAEQINTGASTSYTIIGHPVQREFKYRVSAVSWGPEPDNRTTGVEASFTINSQTPIVDLTRSSLVEMTYAHIKASTSVSGTVKQTFLLDAATGGMSIGLLDGQGNAPITIDGTTGNLSVDGTIITNKIVAASFVLANTNGATNPSFYSAAKTTYGDASDGIFMGHNDTNVFKFDLGNASKYIRWDGSNLRISGDVLIGSGTSSLEDSFINNPSTAYEIVTSLAGIPSTNAGKTAHYTAKIGSAPVTSSVIIYLKNNTVTGGFTKHYSYNGTAWVAFNVVVDGSLLVSGTVSANAIVANTITGNQIEAALHLKVGSGNTNTTISGTDANYRLWVGNNSAASAPFRVTKTGSLELNAEATQSSLIIKNNAIIVRDSSGIIRVQIGDLSV